MCINAQYSKSISLHSCGEMAVSAAQLEHLRHDQVGLFLLALRTAKDVLVAVVLQHSMKHSSIQLAVPKAAILEQALQLLEGVVFGPLVALQVFFQFPKSPFLGVEMFVVGEILAKGSENEVGEGLDLLFSLVLAFIFQNLQATNQRFRVLTKQLLRLFSLLTNYRFQIFDIKVQFIEIELTFLARIVIFSDLSGFLNSLRKMLLKTVGQAEHTRDKMELFRDLLGVAIVREAIHLLL